MMSASFLSVSSAICATASLIVPMSPFFVLPGVTPQSIRMCCGPSSAGTVTRKKSPKPTRYIRIRNSPFSFLCAAISDSSMHHREVHLEAVPVVGVGEAEVLAEAALAIRALLAEMLGDDVADLRLVVLRARLPSNRLTDDQCRAAAQRERAEGRHLVVERLLDRLHSLDNHVGSQASVRIGAEERMKRRDED